MESSPTTTRLIFLDACRDELVPGDRALPSGVLKDLGKGFTKLQELERSFISTSAEPNKTAIDSVKGSLNSPYSEALVQHIDDPCITVGQMMELVRDQVTSATDQKQTPTYSSSLQNGFIFNVDPERCCPGCSRPMVDVRAGSFLMGAPAFEEGSGDDERPRHEVHVDAFAIGKYEVTFAEWDECVAEGGCDHQPNDEGWGRGSRPVIDVSWDDVQQYLKWRSVREGGRQEDHKIPIADRGRMGVCGTCPPSVRRQQLSALSLGR